jgi:hypothetical protein
LKKDEKKKSYGDESYEIQATEPTSAEAFVSRVKQGRLQKTTGN